VEDVSLPFLAPTIYTTIMMTEDEYFEQRLTDQIDWYDRKSSSNKKMFMRLRALEIGMALTIPFLAGYVPIFKEPITLIIGLASILVAGIASILTLYKFQENWIEYRTLSEALKYEKFLYLTKAGVYRNATSFPDFVERVEGILSKENAKWSAQNTSEKQEETADLPE